MRAIKLDSDKLKECRAKLKASRDKEARLNNVINELRKQLRDAEYRIKEEKRRANIAFAGLKEVTARYDAMLGPKGDRP